MNAKYDNTRDREDDVGAGGGVGDEVNKLSRCVYASRISMLGTGDATVVAENGNTDCSRAKTDLSGQQYREIENDIILWPF